MFHILRGQLIKGKRACRNHERHSELPCVELSPEAGGIAVYHIGLEAFKLGGEEIVHRHREPYVLYGHFGYTYLFQPPLFLFRKLGHHTGAGNELRARSAYLFLKLIEGVEAHGIPAPYKLCRHRRHRVGVTVCGDTEHCYPFHSSSPSLSLKACSSK